MDVLKFWWTQRRMRRMARGLVSTEVEVLTSLGTTVSLKMCSSVEVNIGPCCASHSCPSSHCDLTTSSSSTHLALLSVCGVFSRKYK